MTATVLRADARHLPLPDASVDLIVTSPPYFGLRSYTDGGEHYDGQIGSEATPREWLAAMLECTAEWMRVLKPSGSIFVNLGDKFSTGNSGESGMAKLGEKWAGGGHSEAKAKRKSAPVAGLPPKTLLGLPWRYALACMDDLGLILRRDIIWSKPNGLPESVTDRCRSSHEYLFHLVKQPRYYAAVDERRRTITGYACACGARKDQSCDGYGYAAADALAAEEDGASADGAADRLPPTRPALVIDPFGGTGTTALVASMLGRTGVSFDLSADYCRLARWRTRDPAERARALGVPKPPPVPDGQGDLFAEVAL